MLGAGKRCKIPWPGQLALYHSSVLGGGGGGGGGGMGRGENARNYGLGSLPSPSQRGEDALAWADCLPPNKSDRTLLRKIF